MSRCYPKEARPESAFTVVPRELHDTWTIKSDAAFRILSYMLGMPDTWTHSVRSLRRELHMGQARVEGALAELMALGYVTKEAARASGRWAVDYTAHYPPVEVDDEDDHSTVTGQPLRVARNGSAVTGDPSRVSRYGSPVHSKKGDPSKGVQERESKQGNPSLASLAASRGDGSDVVQEDQGEQAATAPLDEEDTSSLAEHTEPPSLRSAPTPVPPPPAPAIDSPTPEPGPTDPSEPATAPGAPEAPPQVSQTTQRAARATNKASLADDRIAIATALDRHAQGERLTRAEQVLVVWGFYLDSMDYRVPSYVKTRTGLHALFSEYLAEGTGIDELGAAVTSWVTNPDARTVTSRGAGRAFIDTALVKARRPQPTKNGTNGHVLPADSILRQGSHERYAAEISKMSAEELAEYGIPVEETKS